MLRRQSKQKETMVPEIDFDFVLQEISLGKQQIVAHNGVSQYRPLGVGGGMSACGLAALNCARIVFGKEEEGVTGNNLLRDLLARQTAEVCDVPRYITLNIVIASVYPFDNVGNYFDMFSLDKLLSSGHGRYRSGSFV